MSKTLRSYIGLFLFPALLLTGCGLSQRNAQAGEEPVANREPATADSVQLPDTVGRRAGRRHESTSATVHCRFDSIGLVNIAGLDSSIAVSLLYATPHNFTGEVMYDFTAAYLHPEAAAALLEAQRLLKEKHPDYTLIVYDAARPMSAQRKMWDVVKGTPNTIYVSNPAHGGGLHNYGLAVDVSILDENNVPLDMGTAVDHFEADAHITNESGLVEKGLITQQAKEHRELLRSVMRGAGFRALPSEWWHFNLYSREVAKTRYTLIE